ncbi:hypothetical protein [Sphingobacterium sp. BIGb0165]|uniref:hypothetical protein n=1 Tax=Sphingobacterium sp. BIGb0165 TaxID=2940615 RepID=UPI002167FC58|nr:hypothetical protein [Sphingobacterium sp. BIGb0165]MCS4225844.1 hypothetical protein [Sphingobacterium sp. BIGb0165]
MAVEYQGKILDEISFKNTEAGNFFVLSDAKNINSVEIEYLPILEKEYIVNDYEIVLFENQYLNAENDVFQLIAKDEDLRIGWIFPLSNLDGIDHDHYENIFLNKYKFVAFQLLLLSENFKVEAININEQLRITDCRKDNPIIVVLSKSSVKKIEGFSIENYLPSLSKYGYYKKNAFNNGNKLASKELYCIKKLRGKLKLNVHKAKIELTTNKFFSELFNKNLKYLDHHLIRFHLLYQIIEHLITESFEKEFDALIQRFQDLKMLKNDFIEQINNIKKERSKIRDIIKMLKTHQKDFDEIALRRDCGLLFEHFNIDQKEDLGDLIYDVRNLVTHNYRAIKSEQLNHLESITHQLELLTINLFEHYKA